MLKTFQRDTKLFEFSRNMNREEMKIRKNNVTLQWLRCNGLVSIKLCCNGLAGMDSLQWFSFLLFVYVSKQSHHLS